MFGRSSLGASSKLRPYRPPDGAKFVAPYRMAGKRGKNDANDVQAICEAVARPTMRFVPVKTIDQQAELFVHRARQGFIEERTALINRIRGLLSELGIVLPQKAAAMRHGAHEVLEELPGWCNTVIGDLLSHLSRLDERIAEYDGHLQRAARENERARQLMRLAGVGPTTASALVATVGNGATSRAQGSSAPGWASCPDSTAPEEGTTGKHHEGGRRVHQDLADPGRTLDADESSSAYRSGQPLGHQTQGAQRLRPCCRGHCREERADVLGSAPSG